MTSTTITQVPLLDLQAQYAPIESDILAAFKQVFEEKRFINGPQVSELEKAVAEYCGTTDAIGVSSGTDALVISLMALDIGPGDEVITSPFTFFATGGSIARVGATPVFVDIDPETYNINPALIEDKITENTKAIIPVHLFGQMADMDPIMALAQKYGLKVIEDGAQAIGCQYNGRPAGSIGDVGCFSFFPSKNLGACGDGGIVTVNDEALAKKLRSLRNHGAEPKYYHQMVGGNFRLDTIQAAVLLVKLPLLESQHEARLKNGTYYDAHLSDTIGKPVVLDKCRMIYNQYTLRTPNRDALIAALSEKKIGHAIYYPVPLHLQECFAYLGYKEGDCPESEKAAQEVVSIPIYAELDDDQLEYVVSAVNGVFN